MRRLAPLCVVAVLALCSRVATVTAAAPADPPPPFDLPALLECRADIASYVAFRRWISDGGAAVARAGFTWRRSQAFEGEYALAHPVTVFGMPARTLGLSDAGVLAVVNGATPRQAAARLHVDILINSASTFVANRLVSANDAARAHAGETQVTPDLAVLLGEKPTQPAYDAQEIVQVVTNLGQPGRTMVGCNYVSSAQTPTLPFPRP